MSLPFSQPNYFDSSETGAPTLNNVAGSLLAVLRACLINGFNAKSVTSITVASGVATATAASHGYLSTYGKLLLIEGSTEPLLNGRKQPLSVATNTFTYAAPGVADGTYTGTISAKRAPAGWQELFAGTANVLCIKPSVPEATGMVLRVDDTGTTNARVVAYEAMTAASTGVGPIPTEVQMSGGLHWPKGTLAAARTWFLVADDRGFYFAISPQATARYTLLYAGDIASLKSGDAYGYLLTGNQADQNAISTVPNGCCGYSHRSARTGAYLARLDTGAGGSVAVQRLGAHHNGSTADVYAGAAGYSVGTYPNGPNNGLLVGALELHANGIRGVLPGLLHPVQAVGLSFNTADIVAGTDDLAGRKLLALMTAPPSGAVVGGPTFIDITGPWSR